MMKKCLIIFVLLFLPLHVCAEDYESVLQKQVEAMDVSELEGILRNMEQGDFSQQYAAFNFKNTMKALANGELDYSVNNILKAAMNYFFKEVSGTYSLALRLLVIALLAALVQNLQSSFDKDGIGNVAFYACFCMIVFAGVKIFTSATAVMAETVDNIILFMNSLIPVLMTLLAAGGNAVSATALHPVLFSATGIITVVIKSFILPLIFTMTALKITDAFSPDMAVGKIGDMLGSIIRWSIGILLTLFIGLIGIYSAVAPAIDDITLKTTKFAVGSFVPVVGGMLSDSVDLVLGCSAILKNAVGISGLIAIVLVCFYPSVRLMVQAAILHITAAVIQPISDKRITGVISTLASSLTMVFAMMITITVMLIIMIAFVVSLGVTT